MTFNELLEKHQESIHDMLTNSNDLDSDAYCDFFQYYCDQNRIPYGVAKARTGDPFEFVMNLIEDDLK